MLKKGMIAATAVLIIAVLLKVGYDTVLHEVIIQPAGSTSLDTADYSGNRSAGGEWIQAAPLPQPEYAADAYGDSADISKEGSESLMQITELIPDRTGNVRLGEISAAAQRVVIHTARMSIQAKDVPGTIDGIQRMAAEMGGWLVASSLDERHSGEISIRVPAELLEQTMNAIQGIAIQTISRRITSEDVTDEYVDLGARLSNELNTQRSLEQLLLNAADSESIIRIETLRYENMASIETIRGRLKLISETAAFSLLTVAVKRIPGTLQVDAGPDLATTAADPVSLSAVFQSPPGLDSFEVTWNMGDGSGPRSGQGTIPLDEDNLRATATSFRTT